MSNEVTKRQQLLLAARGYDVGQIDGVAGPRTTAALDKAADDGIDIVNMARGGGWVPGADQKQAHDLRGQFRAPPKVLVIHYGAGSQASDVAVLTRADQLYISAHFSLGRDGELIQMAPLDTVALHAGDGQLAGAQPYHGRTLNYTAIGIEIENLGWLNRSDDASAWRDVAPKTRKIPLADTVKARHPQRDGPEWHWPKYPADQMAALDRLVDQVLKQWPSIDYIVGHDEVSNQKFDPGPAFDMEGLRARFGKRGPAGLPSPATIPDGYEVAPTGERRRKDLADSRTMKTATAGQVQMATGAMGAVGAFFAQLANAPWYVTAPLALAVAGSLAAAVWYFLKIKRYRRDDHRDWVR